MFCKNCGTEVKDGQAFCTQCGTAQVRAEESVLHQPLTTHYPMKWYKFLIYFLLFFSAVLNALNSINYFTGNIYFVQTNGEITGDMVYSVFGALRILDIAFGICMLGVAALMIITRYKLSGYKADAPKFVILSYALPMAVNVLYTLIGLAITGSINLPSLFGGLIGSGIMIFANCSYFEKRKSLFIN